MNKSIELLKQGFESSSSTTPEFLQFYNTFKKEFTKELKGINATNIIFSKGHFHLSGFFTINDKPYYFSLSDVRGSDYMYQSGQGMKLLYRTVKDYKDFTGGYNQYAKIQPGMCVLMQL